MSGDREPKQSVFCRLLVAFGLALDRFMYRCCPTSLLYAQASCLAQQAAVVNQSHRETDRPKACRQIFPCDRIPLPPSLAQWHDPKQTGDYFDQIKAVPVGYLVWSHFPITIYLQPPTAIELANPFTAQRSQVWLTAVDSSGADMATILTVEAGESGRRGRYSHGSHTAATTGRTRRYRSG